MNEKCYLPKAVPSRSHCESEASQYNQYLVGRSSGHYYHSDNQIKGPSGVGYVNNTLTGFNSTRWTSKPLQPNISTNGIHSELFCYQKPIVTASSKSKVAIIHPTSLINGSTRSYNNHPNHLATVKSGPESNSRCYYYPNLVSKESQSRLLQNGGASCYLNNGMGFTSQKSCQQEVVKMSCCSNARQPYLPAQCSRSPQPPPRTRPKSWIINPECQTLPIECSRKQTMKQDVRRLLPVDAPDEKQQFYSLPRPLPVLDEIPGGNLLKMAFERTKAKTSSPFKTFFKGFGKSKKILLLLLFPH